MKKGPRHLFLRALVDELERQTCAELDDTLPEAVIGGVVVAGSPSYDASTASSEIVARVIEVRVIQTVQSVEANLKVSSLVR
jgi:hypothetical protein